MEELSGKKTIAKNTLVMYIRMFYGMVVSLFTARYILEALGQEDYGIYSVVGSIISLFVFLRSIMGGTIYRFIAFSLGQGDKKRLSEIFSTSVLIHAVLALIIVVLCETIGLWLFYNKLVIPVERQPAAMWCFQISVITCVISIISTPYDSEIVAHERLTVYAITQIFQSTFNLVIAIVLLRTSHDRLIVYALLCLLVQVLIRIFYGFYCGRNFEECHFKKPKDKSIIKELSSFAGWTLLRHMTKVLYVQGINIVLNMFLGPIINAAKGIAQQVQDVVYGFVSNFQMASRPQITKSYAANEVDRMKELVLFVSKISYFLLLIVMLPVVIEAPTLLRLWLGDVPNHTVNFVRISILIMFIQALDFPLGNVIEATGKIVKYNIVISIIQVFILVFSYLALKSGFGPESVYFVQFIILAIILFVKLIMVHNQVDFSIRVYFVQIILKPVLATVLAAIVPIGLSYFLPESIFFTLLICATSVVMVLLSGMFVALTRDERINVKNLVLSYFHRDK